MSEEQLLDSKEQYKRLIVVRNNTCYDILRPFKKNPHLGSLSDQHLTDLIRNIE